MGKKFSIRLTILTRIFNLIKKEKGIDFTTSHYKIHIGLLINLKINQYWNNERLWGKNWSFQNNLYFPFINIICLSILLGIITSKEEEIKQVIDLLKDESSDRFTKLEHLKNYLEASLVLIFIIMGE